ncbi:MAG: PKD domain-containing protein, partial [Crocinitomicaceae bacterium]
SIILVGSGASNYSWNNGITNGVAFIPVGTSIYTVTGTDPNGCKNIDSVLITIIPTPTVDFISNNVLSCSPLAFTLTNNSVGNLTNCKWTLSNGQTFNGCGPVSDTLLAVGCYDVTLLVTTPEGCSNTLTKSDYICVAPDPIAKFYTDPNELSTLVWKANMNNVSIGATTYEWNFGDNTGNSTETNPSHEFPNEEGKTYTITLIATSDIGCVDTTTGNITLVEDLIYYVPNTFTPDANKFNETFLPVFTSGFDPQNYTLLVFDRWGEILFESHNAKIGWDGTFNGKVSPDGTYIWKISFKLKNNDERQDHFGNINLLR